VAISAGGNVRGVESTLRTLRKVNPKLYREAVKRIKSDAKPMQADARSGIPVSLSRWNASTARMQDRRGRRTLRTGGGFPVLVPSKAKSGIGLSVKNKRVTAMTGKMLLIAMVQKDAAGIILEAAGRKSVDSSFEQNLQTKHGTKSRYMWPAAEKNLPAVRASIEKSIKAIEKDLNAELKKRPV